MARSLKTKKTNLIGVFLGNFDGPVFAEIRRGIQQICRMYDYEAIFAECEYSSKVVRKLLNQGFVDGAIIHATNIENEVLEKVASKNFPIVVMDREYKSEYISNVLIDNESAGHNVARRFKELEYNDVGYMEGPSIDYDNNKRIEGFKKGIKEFNLNTNSKWKLNGGYTELGGYKAMQDFLGSNKVFPRAMFITNDEMVFGAIKALRENNIYVPRDIAIVGFDNADKCEFVELNLTTISRPSFELGVIAANCLFDCLEKNKKHKYVCLVHTITSPKNN
ncbi:MAG: LacI family DNA-binding transcriptional regulator [Peptostreptococcaceae bacterium]